MSQPGWYPDPAGQPGHLRYWDGVRWSGSTVPDRRPRPQVDGSPAPGGPSRTAPGLHRPTAAVVTALVVLLLVVTVSVVRHRQPPISSEPQPGATSTAPPEIPSPTPSALPSQALQPEGCSAGDPLHGQASTRGARIRGGGLSVPLPRGWRRGPRAGALFWAYGVGEADRMVHGVWFTGAAVGTLAFEPPDAHAGAELMIGCTATTTFYPGLVSRTDLVNRATTVAGHPAWTITSEIRMDNPYVDVEGDVVEVTVVELDSSDSVSFFWGTAPIGDDVLVDQLDQVRAGLRVG